MKDSLACKKISTGRLQNNVSFNNSEIFSFEKMHKTLQILLLIFKYFILKLAQNTKQFRRLVLENFITVINFLFGRKDILWD